MKQSKARTFLITAGPTIEPIDPVRYISNYSTGTMGYELARVAASRGNEVTLVSGPTTLNAPKKVKLISVKTALEMRNAVLRHFCAADCVVMTAAVADFRPAYFLRKKLKKDSKKKYFLRLVKNPDILSEISRIRLKKSYQKQVKYPKIIVGYALETEAYIKNGRDKMKSKRLDIIVINKAGNKHNPFAGGKKDYVIMRASGDISTFKSVSKRRMSHILLDNVEAMW